MDPQDQQSYLRNTQMIIDSPFLEECIVTRKGITNLAQLSYRELVFQRDHQLLIADFFRTEKNFPLNTFANSRQAHEKRVQTFKLQCSSQDIPYISRQRKRGYSCDSQSLGSYYYNNWISPQEYPCQRPSPQQKTAHLVYEILGLQWSKALQIAESMERTLQVMTLTFLLKGFKAIQGLLHEELPFVVEQIKKRTAFQISYKTSGESIGGTPGPFINAFQQDAKSKFAQIKSAPRKVQIIKMNIDYLVNFASRYNVISKDDYIILAFKLLGNSVDQEQNIQDPTKDYSKILLKLNLKIYDRLNYASKLLNQKKRKNFCKELEEHLTVFPCLDNIIYYLSPNGKAKQQKIDLICRAYLDQYGDLETVAYLSLEFPILKKYYYQFKQILELADQFKQVQRLENFRWRSNTQELKEAIDTKRNKKIVSFFDFLNIAEQKIIEPKMVKDSSNICEICSKKIQKNQNFLECGKCRHGGHAAHLLKWFEQSQNCPHIGCACVCN